MLQFVSTFTSDSNFVLLNHMSLTHINFFHWNTTLAVQCVPSIEMIGFISGGFLTAGICFYHGS